MSSSKIQEYNLDPNMGLAKESTAQEILEKVSGGTNEYRLPTIAGGSYSADATVLSVTGKGRLYYALAKLENAKSSAKTAQFKIVVDGGTVYHVKATSTTSYPIMVYGGIVPITVLEASSYSSSVTSAIMVNNGSSFEEHYISQGYSTEVISEFSATARTYTGTSTTNTEVGKTDHVFINEYLVFNESLEVSVAYGNTAIPCNVCYSLDE